ncbi:uncharacterized protein MELLADRAFT_102411 [Melampsora larici-populina 98AG31]|uniref:Uncharacterized protein n=1 Tax=Melampsora larici-populina (strain 98AG31 / pathotype 3-4-7) TaxID=747676 RepID=F4R876_MELLP|nr:uncharacterized protein MELLADRAFT_102411 [Melampsora larici-populina 98AG31]EGG11662.1 hypothetical protein MELLADRAFT_102411 [Melampsora larici-populina 98AG31]
MIGQSVEYNHVTLGEIMSKRLWSIVKVLIRPSISFVGTLILSIWGVPKWFARTIMRMFWQAGGASAIWRERPIVSNAEFWSIAAVMVAVWWRHRGAAPRDARRQVELKMEKLAG